MAVLLLRLAGPLQAWGVKSRLTVRATELAPSKSGILGMLAAAVGRRRTDPIEDLLTLRFGVRKDQPGTVVRDFHTAHRLDGSKSMPLSERYYLSDAVFLAGIEGENAVIDRLDHAVRHPSFPLYLGRRSCPPSFPVSLGLRDSSLLEALTSEPWLASKWYRRRHREGRAIEVLLDKDAVPEGAHTNDVRGSRDVPLSFDPRHREYSFRDIERHMVRVKDKASTGSAAVRSDVGEDHHDPMAELDPVGMFDPAEMHGPVGMLDPMAELEDPARGLSSLTARKAHEGSAADSHDPMAELSEES